MRRNILPLLTLAALQAGAQTPGDAGLYPGVDYCIRVAEPLARSAGLPPHAAAGLQEAPIDVLSYDLALRASMTDGRLEGSVRIRLLMRAATDSVSLHAVSLVLDTVRVNGTPAAVRPDSAAEAFSVYLPSVVPAGDTVTVDIAYTRPVSASRPGSRRGYYFFDTSIGIPSNLGYTMSEPSDARFWMPCNDVPDDKATAAIAITVPAGYIAASNGRLVETKHNSDGTVTWRWREDHPISTYLMCATISQFTVSSLQYNRAPGDTLPLQYYAWREDSAECAAYLPVVHEMMRSLENLFGRYPFDKYGMTAITPFGFGGMEHQTITTMNRALKTDERVVVHELAHSWWGNDVTCGAWEDIWLNESFATYSEALWKESRGGTQALRQYMAGLQHFNLLSWSGRIYDPGSQWTSLFVDAVYSKGAWVLHTLRGVVGDSLFFTVLDAYRTAFRGGTAVTQDFENVVTAVAGSDHRWFFDQWIRGAGWPRYTMSSSWKPDTLFVNIEQTQNSTWPTFRMPLPVRVYSSLYGDVTVTVVDSLRQQTTAVPLAYVPDSVRLDPDSWVLKEIVGPQTEAVELPQAVALEQNFPNPFNPTTQIRFRLPEDSRVRLEVFDLLGRAVAVLLDDIRSAGTHMVTMDGEGLSSGVYLYRLQAGGSTVSKKMLILR